MEDQVCDWSTVHKPVGDLYEHVNLVGTLVVCLGSSLSTCIIFHSNKKVICLLSIKFSLLTLCMLGYFACFLLSAISKLTFSHYHQECQTVWVQVSMMKPIVLYLDRPIRYCFL